MVMTSDSIAPRVPVPPPLIYGAVLGLGLLFQHLCPIPVAAASIAPILEWLGAIVAACSGVLAAFTFCTFGRYRTTFRTDRQATILVVAGPFRFTRNPLYLSLTLLVAGLSLIANTSWPLALLIPATIMVQRMAIVPEERYLLQRYGHEYEEYCRRVRRWL